MAPVERKLEKEIKPLKTWEEFIQWKQPCENLDEIGIGLNPRFPPYQSEHLKTLVCHDMKGGYLDDRFCNGCSNKDEYRFYNWSGIDTFVYFSHNLITIPPPGWVNAAHIHGVKVLGTFITEWDEGAEICSKLLNHSESVDQAVNALVEIAKYYQIEGWLINIENKIDVNKIELLVDFVNKLTKAMKIHDKESIIIWYDSVTKEGKLEWQNELNEENRLFFDACDGIFLNYTWTSDHLKRTQEAADKRNCDVYVGLDVFGRNFYEGGKYNTHKAMEIARNHDLSIAIFAQGWTFETQDNFEEAEAKLWNSFSPYLSYHGPVGPPFHTSFCQGAGENKYVNGECKEVGDWYNLSEQQHQPIWTNNADVKMRVITKDAFCGGGCLEIHTVKPANIRLLLCKMIWKKALLVSITYKWCKGPVPFGLLLYIQNMSDNSESQTQRFINLHCEGEYKNEDNVIKDDKIISRCDSLNVEKVVDSKTHGWTVKTFQIAEGDGVTLCQFDINLKDSSKILIGKVDIHNICTKGKQDN